MLRNFSRPLYNPQHTPTTTADPPPYEKSATASNLPDQYFHCPHEAPIPFDALLSPPARSTPSLTTLDGLELRIPPALCPPAKSLAIKQSTVAFNHTKQPLKTGSTQSMKDHQGR
ncbi:hypothetical protein NA56DRAFT_713009 [Hyaloscypha hepaticicola]|uniref:Uncharacterized protein n=1 Tax=Hyaloscypha hepaticicola TaxID=2082293 RepID=A0A2J6PF13_9HELO|nr:hypothetical protein NA56DRAFT_713009 [Hyaloscypha hepaticicola]